MAAWGATAGKAPPVCSNPPPKHQLQLHQRNPFCSPADHGHQALADIVIHALQSAAGRAVQQRQAESAAAAAAAVLVQQRSRGPGQARPHTQLLQQPGTVQQAAEQQRQEQEKALAEWMPPPMQRGVIDDGPPALCMLKVRMSLLCHYSAVQSGLCVMPPLAENSMGIVITGCMREQAWPKGEAAGVPAPIKRGQLLLVQAVVDDCVPAG